MSINGSNLDLRMWDKQVEHFSAHFQIIRYDLRGIGKPVMPDEEFSHSADANTKPREGVDGIGILISRTGILDFSSNSAYELGKRGPTLIDLLKYSRIVGTSLERIIDAELKLDEQ